MSRLLTMEPEILYSIFPGQMVTLTRILYCVVSKQAWYKFNRTWSNKMFINPCPNSLESNLPLAVWQSDALTRNQPGSHIQYTPNIHLTLYGSVKYLNSYKNKDSVLYFWANIMKILIKLDWNFLPWFSHISLSEHGITF